MCIESENLSLIQLTNGQLTLANEDAANLINTPLQNMRTAPLGPVGEGRETVAMTSPISFNAQQDAYQGESPLLTRPKPVHVHVAAPNVEVEIQSMKHGLVAKKPTDVSADVSQTLPYLGRLVAYSSMAVSMHREHVTDCFSVSRQHAIRYYVSKYSQPYIVKVARSFWYMIYGTSCHLLPFPNPETSLSKI